MDSPANKVTETETFDYYIALLPLSKLISYLSLRIHLPSIQARGAQEVTTGLYPDILVVLRTDFTQLKRAS